MKSSVRSHGEDAGCSLVAACHLRDALDPSHIENLKIRRSIELASKKLIDGMSKRMLMRDCDGTVWGMYSLSNSVALW